MIDTDAQLPLDPPAVQMLGAQPVKTLRQAAQELNVDIGQARRYWRALGFVNIDDDACVITDVDIEAARGVKSLMDEHGMKQAAVKNMLRAQSYTMDRLVLWQFEAMVAQIAAEKNISDMQARALAIEKANELAENLQDQLLYTWRRHFAALIQRTNSEISAEGPQRRDGHFPLKRSMGFIDIVGFTALAARLSPQELTRLLHDFEDTARDVVTSRGGRIVKTIGDAVMYIANDLSTAADVVTALMEEIQGGSHKLRLRASLVSGEVVSLSGDVFGPTVNLASRLVNMAPPGGIRMDGNTAALIKTSKVASKYMIHPCNKQEAKGLGEIIPWSLKRTEWVLAEKSGTEKR